MQNTVYIYMKAYWVAVGKVCRNTRKAGKRHTEAGVDAPVIQGLQALTPPGRTFSMLKIKYQIDILACRMFYNDIDRTSTLLAFMRTSVLLMEI